MTVLLILSGNRKRNVKGSWPFAFIAAGVESENPITEYGYAEMIRIIPSTWIWSVRRIRAPFMFA